MGSRDLSEGSWALVLVKTTWTKYLCLFLLEGPLDISSPHSAFFVVFSPLAKIKCIPSPPTTPSHWDLKSLNITTLGDCIWHYILNMMNSKQLQLLLNLKPVVSNPVTWLFHSRTCLGCEAHKAGPWECQDESGRQSSNLLHESKRRWVSNCRLQIDYLITVGINVTQWRTGTVNSVTVCNSHIINFLFYNTL